MPIASNGDVDLYYDIFPAEDAPSLLCVPGMGNQLLIFPDEFCLALADRGFQVIRMDNRDAGLSSAMADDVEYTLYDMADDVVAVLDHADIEDAVMLGLSLGGMIVQCVAIRHPSRTRALVSLASDSGTEPLELPSLEVIEALLQPTAPTPAEQVEADLVARRLWSNPEWFDEEQMRAYFASLYERAWVPGGGLRQFEAVARTPRRGPLLAELDVPALIVHGENDTLIPLAEGQRTAELIPGAAYLEIEGMSHDFVAQMWPPLIEAVTALTARTFS